MANITSLDTRADGSLLYPFMRMRAFPLTLPMPPQYPRCFYPTLLGQPKPLKSLCHCPVGCVFPSASHTLPSAACRILGTQMTFLKKNTIFYLWVFCLHVCLCASCMPRAWRNQKRASDPLERKSLTVVECPHGCLEWNPGSLKEQPVLLICEPSLQPRHNLLSVVSYL